MLLSKSLDSQLFENLEIPADHDLFMNTAVLDVDTIAMQYLIIQRIHVIGCCVTMAMQQTDLEHLTLQTIQEEMTSHYKQV